MNARPALHLAILACCLCTNLQGVTNSLPPAKRIVFLGDSITHSGEYVTYVEACLRTHFPEREFDIIDVGLPSETVSGLSEPGHAGGKFPRPNLHERLDRVLQKLKPELVIACYGMNDGIYYPYGDDRFAAFTNGIRLLREKVLATGAQIIHLTPPVFDPLPLKGKTLPAGLKEYRQPYENYDQVLTRYSEWLLSQRTNAWQVIDIHGPMKRYLELRRKDSPQFILAGDGVHANATGHLLMAEQILLAWGVPGGSFSSEDGLTFRWRTDEPRDPSAKKSADQLLASIRKRQKILTDAWLSEIGHSRPGMTRGLPIAEALEQAKSLNQEIKALSGTVIIEINTRLAPRPQP